MNTKRRFLIALLTSTLAVGTIPQAVPGGQFGGKHGGERSAEHMQKRLDHMAQELGLSDAQKQQVKALFENKRNNMKPQHEERKALHERMAQLDPTASDYDQKLAEIANTKSELSRQRTISKGQTRKQMAQILTPEQQVKLKELRKNRKGGGKRRGHGKKWGEGQPS